MPPKLLQYHSAMLMSPSPRTVESKIFTSLVRALPFAPQSFIKLPLVVEYGSRAANFVDFAG